MQLHSLNDVIGLSFANQAIDYSMAVSRVSFQILGCGNAFASGGRFHTCFLVRGRNFSFLLDCGASSIVALRKNSISLSSINAIVLSHLHADHAAGVPFVVLARSVEDPDLSSLKVYGPTGTRQMLDQLFALFFPETIAPAVECFEYEQGITTAGPLTILAQPARHVIQTNPHSLRIAFHDKIIAFSGDTAWYDGLVSLSANADLFVCECTNVQSVKNHMSYNDLLTHRRLFTAKRMLLTHMDIDMLQLENCAFERGFDGQQIILD